MPIPASGPISMSMINTELGRASNTSNTSLAGGSTPTVGSLFGIGGVSGSLDQTAPHFISEWRSYEKGFAVTVFAKINSGTGNIQLQYSADNQATWNDLGFVFNSTVCASRGTTAKLPLGNDVYFRAFNIDDSLVYAHTKANDTTICPSLSGPGCSSNITSLTADRTIAINVSLISSC